MKLKQLHPPNQLATKLQQHMAKIYFVQIPDTAMLYPVMEVFYNNHSVSGYINMTEENLPITIMIDLKPIISFPLKLDLLKERYKGDVIQFYLTKATSVPFQVGQASFPSDGDIKVKTRYTYDPNTAEGNEIATYIRNYYVDYITLGVTKYVRGLQ